MFYPQLTTLFATDPAMGLIADQLEAMRKAPGAGQSATDDLFQLWQAYRMLGGLTTPDGHLVEVLLRDQGRWYAGLTAKNSCTPEFQRKADVLLAYLVAHLRSSAGWQGHADDAVVQRVQNTLGDSTAILTKYADAEASVQSRIGDVSKDAIVGPDEGGDLVTLSSGISRIYTRDGYSSVFRQVLSAKSIELLHRYAELGKERTPSDVLRELRTLYFRRYNQAWLELAASLKPSPCDSLSDASARLRAIAGPDSPYKAFAASLKTAASWHYEDADARMILPSDGKWLDDGLTAAGELQRALDDFLTATQAGSRLADPSKLALLGAAADKAATAFDTATSGMDDRAAADACRTCLTNIGGCVRAAAASELIGELDRVWQEQVVRTYADQLQARYPFTLSSAQDAPLGPFATVFNAKSGSFWVVVRQVEAMRKVRFGGQPLLTPSSDYLRMYQPAKALTDSFFADGSETLATSCIVTLEPREGLKDIAFAMGGQRLKLYDRPDRRAQLSWKQGEPAGSKLSIQLANGRWLLKEQPGAAFGILRLLREGKAEARPAGGTRLTWSFDAPDLGKAYNASLVLESPGLEYLVVNSLPALPQHLNQ